MTIDELEKEIRNKDSIKAYGKMNQMDYKNWRNDLLVKCSNYSNANNHTKKKELSDMKHSLIYSIHQKNKGDTYRNGILEFTIAVLSGALIDNAVLKSIADSFSTNNIVLTIALIVILITLIIYGVFIKRSQDEANYYEDVISIIDEALEKIA